MISRSDSDSGVGEQCSELPYIEFTVQVPIVSNDLEEPSDARTELAQTLIDVLTSSRPEVLESMNVEQAKRILVSIYRAIDQVHGIEVCEC